jgi:hypothetical protein
VCSAVVMVRTVSGGFVVGRGVTRPRYRLGARVHMSPK